MPKRFKKLRRLKHSIDWYGDIDCPPLDDHIEEYPTPSHQSQKASKLTTTPTQPNTLKPFTAPEFNRLSMNEFGRFTPAADKISHAVFNPQTKEIEQFAPPEGVTDRHQWRPLEKVECQIRGGTLQAEAQTPGGTKMRA